MPYTEALAKQLINTDVPSNGDINRLRYLFVEEPNQVLFGIGFNHRHVLPEELHTDFSNRRGLRSFVGVVVNKEEFDNLESIPISSEFYIDLYKKIVYNTKNVFLQCEENVLFSSKTYCSPF